MGTKGGDLFECVAVAVGLDGMNLKHQEVHVVVERPLRQLVEFVWIDSAMTVDLRLTEDMLDPLERCRYRDEILGAAYGGKGFGACDGISHIIKSRGENRIDHAIGEAAHVTEIKFHSLTEKRTKLAILHSEQVRNSQRQA